MSSTKSKGGSTQIQMPCGRGEKSVERSFGTIKARIGATHFLMKRLPNVAREMALHVLAYDLARVFNIMGARPLMATIQR